MSELYMNVIIIIIIIIMSYDKSVASSEVTSSDIVVCFLVKFPVSSCFLKDVQ